MQPVASSLRTSIDLLLGDDDLGHFVRARRLEGLSWRRIALDIYEVTGGAEVTVESLRNWFPDDDPDDEDATS